MWYNFFKCKNLFWSDCPFDSVLVTNEETPNIPEIKIINCGADASWSERMRKALSEIDSEYICFLLEDFFITEKIDTEKILEALDLMEENNIKYYKLLTINPFVTAVYKDTHHLQIIPANYPYGISLMAALWNKEYFLEKIGLDNYNPWKFESDRLKEEKYGDESDIIGIFDNRNILNITHMVVQGEYLPTSVKKIRKIGLKIKTSERTIMSSASYLLYKFKGFVGIKIRQYPALKQLLSPFIRKYSIAYRNK